MQLKKNGNVQESENRTACFASHRRYLRLWQQVILERSCKPAAGGGGQACRLEGLSSPRGTAGVVRRRQCRSDNGNASPGLADGHIGSLTMAALGRYQRGDDIAEGQLTMEMLRRIQMP